MKRGRMEVSGYWVRYERDAAGWLVGRVPALPGCLTQAKTVRELRARMAEAIGLFEVMSLSPSPRT